MGNIRGLEGGERGLSAWEVEATVISYSGRRGYGAEEGLGVSSGRTDKIEELLEKRWSSSSAPF